MMAQVSGWRAVLLLTLVQTFGICSGTNPLAAGEGCSEPCPWAGVYPTVLTPFCADSGIDVGSLEHQLQFELSGGVHGLLLLGTIGEGQYTSMEEREQVIRTAVRVVAGRGPIIVGIHTCDFETAKCQLLQAKTLGASAVLVKYIGQPRASCAEVIGFYAALTELQVLPIFYYHYPSQTGLQLPPETIAEILSLPGVVGIKESTLNLGEVKKHICLMRGQGKAFLSGTALNMTQFMNLGGHGAMCPEAVLLPGPTVRCYDAYIHGQCATARAIQSELFEMTPILRSRPTPPFIARAMLMSAEDHQLPVPMGKDQPQARLKAALNCMGVCTPTAVKCPLPPLSSHDKSRVESTVCRLKCIDWCSLTPIPPVPLHTCSENDDWGGLLRTGGIQLGPNVGRDLTRWQWDGEGGF